MGRGLLNRRVLLVWLRHGERVEPRHGQCSAGLNCHLPQRAVFTVTGGHLMTLPANFRRDRSGTAAVEFALILPGLLIMVFGSYEVANLILADLKLEAATETASDLVAQTRINTVLQAADFTNITNAATQVMTPFPTGSNQLKIAYASVTYSTGAPVIDWHVEVNSATPISASSLPNSANAANLGNE